MKCPYCGADDQSNVISTRTREYGIKRMRLCSKCEHRFSTIEIVKISDEAIKSLQFSNKRMLTKERKRE